jgi:hypothetical protein
MSRVDQWLLAAIPERPGLFRGLQVGMPLREALSLEGRDIQRASDLLLIREDLDAHSWSELDLKFYRRKGADRLNGATFCLTTAKHFFDVEAVFQKVVEHYTSALGAAQPLAFKGPPPGTRRLRGAAWRFSAGRVPSALWVVLRDQVQGGRERRCSVELELARAGARA